MKLKSKRDLKDKWVITKAETIQVLGVQRLELILFENAARIPKNPSRKGYTLQEYKRLLKKAKNFYGTLGKRGAPIKSY